MIALDASAVLAFMFRESGHDVVAAQVDNACLSTVNLCEVLARFARDGHDIAPVLDHFRRSSIELVPFDDEQAGVAAGLVPHTRTLGLSLGDRACLALAMTRGLPALTTDRRWSQAVRGVEIRLAR